MTGGTLFAGVLNFEGPHDAAWLFLGVALAVLLGPQVAARLRLPPIIGLLAGGLVIGPQVTGIVPATDTTVAALGQLGLLYLMFSAGVELDLALFRRYRRAAVTFGLVTFTAPMVLGFGAGRLLDYSFPASLLLGSLWASHTLVTYPMVRQAGLSGNRAVAATVGATVITDTLSLIVLAGVSGTVTGESGLVNVVASLIVGLVALGFYAVVVLPRLAAWFFAGPGHDGPARFVFLLAALLSAAVLSEMVGIEGIVGAFFAGLGLNRTVPVGSVLMERVEFLGTSLLVPVFLVSVGVLIEPSVIVEPATLGLAAVFCGAVIGGKGIAALVTQRLLGFIGGEAGLMFGMTLPQAAATLAATFVGFDIGLFGERVVNAVLVVILVTLLVAAMTAARALRSVEPTTVEGGVDLGRRLLLVPGREDRLVALARVGRALTQAEGGVVTALRVSRGAREAADDRSFLDLVEAVLARTGLEVHARLRVATDPVEAVAATAIEGEATLVLVDWQAASRSQAAVRGGRDDVLLNAVPVPVLLAALSDAPVKRVVLAFDRVDLGPDSTGDAALAVQVAARLAGHDCERVVIGPDDPALAQLAAGFAAPRDPGRSSRVDWLSERTEPGDLVVVPAHPLWSEFGPAVVEASARSGVSVLVAADPPRWIDRTPPADETLGAVVGLARKAATRWS